MFASSILSLALLLAAPPEPERTQPEPSALPTITLDELNAFVKAGNYHRIRIEKLGHILETTGKVELFATHDGLPIVDFPGFLRAGLQGLPKDHGLVIGDRIRFRGLIASEDYAHLQVWTYDFEKLPPLPDGADGVDVVDAEPANADPAKAEETPAAELPAIRFCESAPAESEPAAPSPASLAKSSEELLPKVTTADLDAAKDGDYLRVRREMIGHRLYADAVVEKVGAWPLVRLSENWQAHLRSHSDDMGLKEGDRIRFHGLIVDDAYSAVTVWVERVEKLPADAAPAN